RVDTTAHHHDGELHAALGALDRGARFGPSDPATLHHDPLAPIHELRAPGHQVHHEVAVGFAEPNHGAGGQGVEHELCGGTRLETGRTGEHLGTDDRI